MPTELLFDWFLCLYLVVWAFVSVLWNTLFNICLMLIHIVTVGVLRNKWWRGWTPI